MWRAPKGDKICEKVLKILWSKNNRPQAEPPHVFQRCVVYLFQCVLCDAGYVSYTCRHLYQRTEEHKGSAIGNHLREQHDMEPEDIAESFRIIRKC